MNKDWVDYVTFWIAVVAFFQPWLIYFYKKVIDKPALECYENKTLLYILTTLVLAYTAH